MAPLHALTVTSVSMLICLGGLASASTDFDSSTTDSTGGTYSLSLQAAGGYNGDLSSYTGRKGLTLNRNQFFSYAQIRWLPGNNLTGAVEAGYLNFYTVSTDAGAFSVRSAIPICVVFSMTPFEGFEISCGFGIGILSSHVSGVIGDARSTAVTMLTMGSLTYLYPISSTLEVGAEARISYMDLYDDKVVGIGAVVRHHLFDY